MDTDGSIAADAMVQHGTLMILARILSMLMPECRDKGASLLSLDLQHPHLREMISTHPIAPNTSSYTSFMFPDTGRLKNQHCSSNHLSALLFPLHSKIWTVDENCSHQLLHDPLHQDLPGVGNDQVRADDRNFLSKQF